MTRRVRRHLAAIALGWVLMGTADPVAAAPCWSPPVVGAVVDPFRPPGCRWCAGNRGIEYRARPGSPVRSVAGGVVTFAGRVAQQRYVVVRQPDGWQLTYGVASAAVREGDAVARDAIVGVAGSSVHFGLRIGGEYRDPAPYLGTLRGRPRLLPDAGEPAPSPPGTRLVCGSDIGRVARRSSPR